MTAKCRPPSSWMASKAGFIERRIVSACALTERSGWVPGNVLLRRDVAEQSALRIDLAAHGLVPR
jgi:hypothetical protein